MVTSALMTVQTSVNFYQTTQRNIWEDSHLHTRRHGNLNFHQVPRFMEQRSQYDRMQSIIRCYQTNFIFVRLSEMKVADAITQKEKD
jgi:hypothetical protein